MLSQQMQFQFAKTSKQKSNSASITCLECERHNRFWICEATGKNMNPCYCAKPCKFFKPKSRVQL